MHEFIEKQVLVHPELTHDPLHRQGQIATVAHVVQENDEVFVDFPDGRQGVYEHDALLTLKPPSLILENIKLGNIELMGTDWQTLLLIYLLQGSGKPGTIADALKQSMTNKTVLATATISLQDWNDRGLSEHPDFDNIPVRQR